MSTRRWATSRSLMLRCWDARRRMSNAWSAVIRSRVHQNTLCLADQVPANQGGLQVGDPGVFGLTGFGGGQRQAGQDGKHDSFGAVGGPERPRVGGVAVERSRCVAGGEVYRQRAAYPGLDRGAGELRPRAVLGEVFGVDGAGLRYCV